MTGDVPFEGGGFILPVHRGGRPERLAAARMLTRLAGSDRDGLVTVLEALGLIPYQESESA